MSFRSEVHSFSLTHPFPGQKLSSRRHEDFLSSFGHHGVHLAEIFLISLGMIGAVMLADGMIMREERTV